MLRRVVRLCLWLIRSWKHFLLVVCVFDMSRPEDIEAAILPNRHAIGSSTSTRDMQTTKTQDQLSVSTKSPVGASQTLVNIMNQSTNNSNFNHLANAVTSGTTAGTKHKFMKNPKLKESQAVNDNIVVNNGKTFDALERPTKDIIHTNTRMKLHDKAHKSNGTSDETQEATQKLQKHVSSKQKVASTSNLKPGSIIRNLALSTQTQYLKQGSPPLHTLSQGNDGSPKSPLSGYDNSHSGLDLKPLPKAAEHKETRVEPLSYFKQGSPPLYMISQSDTAPPKSRLLGYGSNYGLDPKPLSQAAGRKETTVQHLSTRNDHSDIGQGFHSQFFQPTILQETKAPIQASQDLLVTTARSDKKQPVTPADDDTKRKTSIAASFWNGSAEKQQSRAQHEHKRTTYKSIGGSAPLRKPSLSIKSRVEWNAVWQMYAYRVPLETRLLVRHAQLPLQGSPWPMPHRIKTEPEVYVIRPGHFRFHVIGESCDILDFQFARFRRNVFLDADGREKAEKIADGYTELHQLNVTVLKDCPKYPSLQDDEAYDLDIDESGAYVLAREVWGAVRALETFGQLIYRDQNGQYVVNRTTINDFPRFPHRGVLLDTSRHYLDKDTIITNLEAMAQNKLNVFHWHIVDDQSFPFESRTFPNLTKYGAYNADTHVYTHKMIKEIIAEARLRGIRVIPEFNSPGHSLSWGFGQDHLLTPCYNRKSGQPNGYYGSINPVLKSTYNFLQLLFAEVLSVFKDEFVHLGGDDFSVDCWNSNPLIRKFIKNNNLNNIRAMLSVYVKKLLGIVDNLGKRRPQGAKSIIWQDVVENGVDVGPETIVQMWRGETGALKSMLDLGHPVLYSTCWDLDHITYGQDWDKFYVCNGLDRLNQSDTKNKSLLLGGEVKLWTEFVSEDNIMSRLWRGLKVGVLSGPGHCPGYSSKSTNERSKQSMFHQIDDTRFQLNINNPEVYVVDVTSLYLVPVIIIICICCLTLLSLNQNRNRAASSSQRRKTKSRDINIVSLTSPVSRNPIMPCSWISRGSMGYNTKKKPLMFVFMVLSLTWCIWTLPLWLSR